MERQRDNVSWRFYDDFLMNESAVNVLKHW